MKVKERVIHQKKEDNKDQNYKDVMVFISNVIYCNSYFQHSLISKAISEVIKLEKDEE